MTHKVLAVLLCIICLFSCKQKSESYTIYWQDNNLCVVMPHPTMGLVELGKVNWNGVELEKVVDDIYNECVQTNKSGNIAVWVRFENQQTDKYGNETMAYEDHAIAIIPLSEARKYQSGKYLDNEYKLKHGLHNAAFGDLQY